MRGMTTIMLRAFQTHKLRRQTELAQLWRFTPDEAADGKEAIDVLVPSCWETYPGYGDYRGSARYETTFVGGGNLRVAFGSVSHTADVYLDGTKIARHYNAYTPFSAIAPRKAAGRHTLRVDVSNAFGEESSLHIPNDYMTYGGITRPVVIEEVPDAYIEWVHAAPIIDGDTWHLDVQVKICNLSADNKLVYIGFKMEGYSGELGGAEIPANGFSVLEKRLRLPGVDAYNPNDPRLYLLETQLRETETGEPADDLIERVGFRVVSAAGKDILFNGQKITIKGLCRHEDHPQFGCAIPYEAMDYDLRQMIDMGANAVRATHYPYDQRFLDLCDERGILVWEESHARALSEEQMRNPHFKRQSGDCIREMIDAHYNHPSIIIWGILNECASCTEYGRECYIEQFKQIKAMDPYRPASFASCTPQKDLCMDLPDIISFNVYPRWYIDISPPECLEGIYNWVQSETGGAGKPFLITEVGAGGIYNYHSPYAPKWSEERQARIIAEQLDAIFAFSGCSGAFVWQYCDCRVSEEWFASRPRSMNNKGVVDEYRRPKLAYDAVKEVFTK